MSSGVWRLCSPHSPVIAEIGIAVGFKILLVAIEHERYRTRTATAALARHICHRVSNAPHASATLAIYPDPNPTTPPNPKPPQVDAQRRAELEVVTQLRAAKRALETLTAAAPGLD